jgi:hypothetical protein
MTNTNNLKDMSDADVLSYIRKLELETKTQPKCPEQLYGYSIFKKEEYVAELEKERGFQELGT